MRGPRKDRFGPVALLIWGNRLKDQDNSAKSSENSDCNNGNHRKREDEST